MKVKFTMIKEYIDLIFVYHEYRNGTRDIHVYEDRPEEINLLFVKCGEFAHSRKSFEKECSRIRRELKK